MSYKVFLSSTFEPVAEADAELIKVVQDDGKVSFYHPKIAAPINQMKMDVHAWYAVVDEMEAPPAPVDMQDQRRMLERIVKKWQGILLLDDWNITFTMKDVPRVEQGIVVSFSEKKAEIDLSLRLTEQQAEEDIAHELLHVVLYPENWDYDAFADDMVARNAISKEEYDSLQERYNLAQNIVIEHFKRIFAAAGVGQS